MDSNKKQQVTTKREAINRCSELLGEMSKEMHRMKKRMDLVNSILKKLIEDDDDEVVDGDVKMNEEYAFVEDNTRAPE